MATDRNTYKTAHDILIPGYRGGSSQPYPPFTLPAGLRCKPCTPGVLTRFFLDELPLDLFPSGSFLRHDASHYGIILDAVDVGITYYVESDWPTSKALTVEAALEARTKASYPYAHERRRGKPLTLQFRCDGDYEVVYGDKMLYSGPDLVVALESFQHA